MSALQGHSTSPTPTGTTSDAPVLPPADAFHRQPRTITQRHHWWRPPIAVATALAAYLVMLALFTVAVLIPGEIWPAFASTQMLTDPRNPADMLIMFGLLALLIPAVLIGTRVGYGRAGIVHSVRGRLRWGLMGRAVVLVVPVLLLTNTGFVLASSPGGIEVPAPTVDVIAAWVILLVLAPLQSAGEEYAFRALPMQAMGTWLRSPVWGILLPVPLFMWGHGYDWLGQIDLAVFAILMGALAWKTGGLELPILMHAANNATLSVVAPLLPGSLEQAEVTVWQLMASTIPSIVLTAALWWWYSRREGLRFREPTRGRAPSRPDRPVRGSRHHRRDREVTGWAGADGPR